MSAAMGCMWVDPTPRTRDVDARRRERAAAVLLVVALLISAWLAWDRRHAVQAYRDRSCAAGSTVACALDGRHP